MASSDEESSMSSEPNRWIPISERSEWSDVQPVRQDEGPAPVVRIAYSKKCRFLNFTMSYGFIEWRPVCKCCRMKLMTDSLANGHPSDYKEWLHTVFLAIGCWCTFIALFLSNWHKYKHPLTQHITPWVLESRITFCHNGIKMGIKNIAPGVRTKVRLNQVLLDFFL